MERLPMSSFDLLKAAENYTQARGDYEWFCEYYVFAREAMSVKDSIDYALWQIYNANPLEEVG